MLNLRTVYASHAPRATSVSLWRRGRDSNPGYRKRYNGFRGRRLQPLGHLSRIAEDILAHTRMLINQFVINQFVHGVDKMHA